MKELYRSLAAFQQEMNHKLEMLSGDFKEMEHIAMQRNDVVPREYLDDWIRTYEEQKSLAKNREERIRELEEQCRLSHEMGRSGAIVDICIVLFVIGVVKILVMVAV